MTESDPVPSYEQSLSLRDPAPTSLVHHCFKREELSIEFSSYAKSSTSTPVFHPHSIIEGSVILTLGKEQTLREISITAECGLEAVPLDFHSDGEGGVYGRNRFKPFWAVTTVVCKKKTSLPAGAHVFPFSFEIPKSSKPCDEKFFGSAESNLPPNIMDPGLPYTIQYSLLAEVKYGFMKVDRVLPVLFRHIPITRPNRSPSPAIARAYSLGDHMPSPSADPLGYLQESVVITGTIFSKPFMLECQIFLPKPTAYRTGTRINFFLKVVPPPNEGETPANIQAADLLLLPNSTSMCLQRLTRLHGRFASEFTETVGTAKTWQRRDEIDGRLLQGEITVPAGARTDFAFISIELFHRVTLEICAPGVVINTAGPSISRNQRQPSSWQHQPVFYVPVKLVNAARAGDPEPPSYAPVPAYNEDPGPPPLPPRRPSNVQTRRGYF